MPVVTSAAMARELLGHFWAITPLPTLHPAAVRGKAGARAMSDEEWALLEPGRWYVWVDQALSRDGRDWVRIDVAKA